MSETEGRLEVCFSQRWTTVDGNGWTYSDTQVACRQLGYSASGTLIFYFSLSNVYISSDISYTTNDRTSGHTLPASITLVGCYGNEERLVDCAYHDYTDSKTSSMDVWISCSSSSEEEAAASISSASAASLSIAVICIVAVAIVSAILIAMFILRRQKKKNAAK